MNKNLAHLLPDVVDELEASFKDVFDTKLKKEGQYACLRVSKIA
jgi:hypothetical protein